MNKLVALFLLLALFCRMSYSQEITGFTVNPDSHNVAALFTMTDESGRLRNLDLMESIFKDGSLGFKCQRHHNVSSEYIYNKITEIAKTLKDDSTLLLYFNSHGGGSGDRFAMSAQGGSFKFSKAMDALKKSNKKVRRLILLVDTCHAEGSIQDSLKLDGDLLKNIKSAIPTNHLPEISDKFSFKEIPFSSFFINYERKNKEYILKTKNGKIDFFEDDGIYDEILIISSCSVEDLSTRGVFASRIAETFKKVKEDKSITVGEFLKRFADSHSESGQQPYYKILPNKSMLEELLFGPWPAQKIPIKDHGSNQKFNFDYILIPR